MSNENQEWNIGRGIKKANKEIDKYFDLEHNMILPWAIYLSRLRFGHNSYQETFGKLIPENYKDIYDYIVSNLSSKEGKLIGIDVGGLGSNVFKDFVSGFFQKTLGLTLTDQRKKYKIDINQDEARNHKVIAGNFRLGSTKSEIKRELSGKKVDLLFERMAGGLGLMPYDDKWAVKSLEYLYSLLSEIGIMFVQLEYDVTDEEKLSIFSPKKIEEVVNLLKEKYGHVLEIGYDGKSLLIRKLKNAPELLILNYF